MLLQRVCHVFSQEQQWLWHRRLAMDLFLKLVSGSIQQSLSQLKARASDSSAGLLYGWSQVLQRSGTAGPDVLMPLDLQYKLRWWP